MPKGLCLITVGHFQMVQEDLCVSQGKIREHCIMVIWLDHCIEFQSVVALNGIMANLFGSVKRKYYGSATLADSLVLIELEQHSFGIVMGTLCTFRESTYPLRFHLQ